MLRLSRPNRHHGVFVFGASIVVTFNVLVSVSVAESLYDAWYRYRITRRGAVPVR